MTRASSMQQSTQRQIPRACTNVDRLGIIADDPILTDWIPIREIATSDLIRKGLRLPWVEDQIVETAEDNFGIVGSAETKILQSCG